MIASVIIAAACTIVIAVTVAVIAIQFHTVIKCMVKMAENQKKHSEKIERIEEQRRQDYLDMQLRVSHIEDRLNRMGSRKQKGKYRW